MHIEVDLDDSYSEKFMLLQEQLHKNMSEILAMFIDWATLQSNAKVQKLPEPMSVGQWSVENFSRENLYDDDGR